MLRFRMVGADPGPDGSHFASPSDCSEWSCRDSAFDVRDKVNDAEREEVCAELAAEWKRLEAERAAGGKSSVARRAPGCPIRTSIGGAGGGRILGLPPEPVLCSTREITVDRRWDVGGLSSEFVDKNGGAAGGLGQRAKPPPPGGKMHVYSSSGGKKIALPSLMSLSEAKLSFRGGAPCPSGGGALSEAKFGPLVLPGGGRRRRAYAQIRLRGGLAGAERANFRYCGFRLIQRYPFPSNRLLTPWHLGCVSSGLGICVWGKTLGQ